MSLLATACTTPSPSAKAPEHDSTSEQRAAEQAPEFAVELEDSPVLPVADSPIKGDANAWVTVMVFGDFQDPFSARLAATLDEVLAGADDRRVRRVFKYHPGRDSPSALAAARAAEAAHRQGQFWAMHDGLFDAFNDLDGDDTAAVIDGIARQIGLDMERFYDDLDDPQLQARVDADRQLAADLDLAPMPAVFISGGYLPGVQSHLTYTQTIASVDTTLRQAVDDDQWSRDQVYRRAVDALFDHTRQTARSPDERRTPPVSAIPVGGDAPSTGSIDDAVVQIGAFINLGAPPTQAMLAILLDELDGSDGDLRLTFFHLPRADDDLAILAHRALEAVENGAATRDFLAQLVGDTTWHDDAERLGEIIDDVGIEPIDRQTFEQILQTDRRAAAEYGIFATPTIFVNGIPRAGLRDRDEFASLIDDQRQLGHRIQRQEELVGWQLYERLVDHNRP